MSFTGLISWRPFCEMGNEWQWWYYTLYLGQAFCWNTHKIDISLISDVLVTAAFCFHLLQNSIFYTFNITCTRHTLRNLIKTCFLLLHVSHPTCNLDTLFSDDEHCHYKLVSVNCQLRSNVNNQIYNLWIFHYLVQWHQCLIKCPSVNDSDDNKIRMKVYSNSHYWVFKQLHPPGFLMPAFCRCHRNYSTVSYNFHYDFFKTEWLLYNTFFW